MPPQEPNPTPPQNPTPAPAEPPTPPVVTDTPPATPPVTPPVTPAAEEPEAASTPEQPAAPTVPPAAPVADKKKNLKLMIIIAVAVVLVLGGGAFAYFKFFASSIKLTNYSGKNFTLQVPADYKVEENSDGVSFTEKEGSEDTQSMIFAYYQKYPTTLTSEDIKTVKDSLKSGLEDAANGAVSEDGYEIANVKTSETKYKGNDALKLSADAKRDNKVVGTVDLVAVTTSKELYMVGVAAHESDPGLAKKVNTILDSFTVK